MLATSPLLGLLVAFAAGLFPGLGFWAGSRLAEAFASAAASPGFVLHVAVGLGVSAAVAGLTVALLAPGLEALGPQVEAAPRSRASLAAGAVVVPVAGAAAAVAAILLPFAIPLAGPTGVVLLLVGLACAALGAAAGEGARLAAAGERAGLAFLVAATSVWVAAGALGRGGAYLGPAATVGTGSAVAAPAAVIAAGGALWIAASAVTRRERAATRRARMRWLPASAAPALALISARRVLRHPELRVHGLTAVALPLAAVVAARAALGVDGAPATAFCVAVTLTATALYPSAALGFARASRWLLSAAPRRHGELAAAAAIGGIGAASALVAAAGILAVPVGPPDARTVLELESATAFVLGAATLAGAFVPWDPGRVLHQLGAYAAVLVLVGGAWLALGRLAPLVDDPTAFAVVAGHVVLGAGVAGAAAVAR